MKNTLLLFIGFAWSLAIHAQSCPQWDLGSKTNYKYIVGLSRPTPAPAGYEAVFINDVGRHGSRHLTKVVDSADGYKLLIAANNKQQLTTKGKKLLSILDTLKGIENPNVKSISILGQQEQKAIASRMYSGYKKLVQSKYADIQRIMVTSEIRTQQTAYAFLSELKILTGDKDSIPYIINDTVLRFYDDCPTYTKYKKSGSWTKEMEALKKATNYKSTTDAIWAIFFQSSFNEKITDTIKEKFAEDIYGFLSIIPSIENEIRLNKSTLTLNSLKQFFTCKQLIALNLITDAEDYLLKGPGTNNNGIQVKIARPLLVDFMNATDNFIKNGTNAIRLRFTHAEAIAPFAALLGLQNADSSVKDITTFKRYWQAANVIPLSSNIRWILYRNNKTNKWLVKFLLNERQVKVRGLTTNIFPFYDWEKVKALYQSKLATIPVGLCD